MKTCLFILGTRPEAIKLAPVIKLFLKSNYFKTIICNTGQHRAMVDQIMNFFDIKPDYDLNIIKPNQSLSQISQAILNKLDIILDETNPDYIFVQGDTSTTFISALCAFYKKIKICHIESGLRTYNKYSPFPEEMNRVLTTHLADYHFAPTNNSRKNLLNENIAKDKILVTGNTVIDALLDGINVIKEKNNKGNSIKGITLNNDIPKILVTVHRRENHGEKFIEICNALKQVAKKRKVQIIFPVHLNPNIKEPANKVLKDVKNIMLIEPQSYEVFIWLMYNSSFIISDSGGIQEEAPSLGKPVLVVRERTERPEAIKAGTIKLIGTNKDTIVKECLNLLDDKKLYANMSQKKNPFGDGNASLKILKFMKNIK